VGIQRAIALWYVTEVFVLDFELKVNKATKKRTEHFVQRFSKTVPVFLCKYNLYMWFIFFFFKGTVHFEINFWYVLVYLEGIQDVDVFVSAVVSILTFLGQTVLVYRSYNGGLWSPPQRACTEKSKLNMI